MNAERMMEKCGANAKQVLEAVYPIAESYADACLFLGLETEAAEDAILSMAGKYGGCLNCRHSRATERAVDYARQRGTLPITSRGCILGLRQDGCQAREPIINPDA